MSSHKLLGANTLIVRLNGHVDIGRSPLDNTIRVEGDRPVKITRTGNKGATLTLQHSPHKPAEKAHTTIEVPEHVDVVIIDSSVQSYNAGDLKVGTVQG